MKANQIQIDRINRSKKKVENIFYEANGKKFLVGTSEIEVLPIKYVEYWNKKATRYEWLFCVNLQSDKLDIFLNLQLLAMLLLSWRIGTSLYSSNL